MTFLAKTKAKGRAHKNDKSNGLISFSFIQSVLVFFIFAFILFSGINVVMNQMNYNY